MPSAKQTLRDLIAKDPLGLRNALVDRALLKELEKIGVGGGLMPIQVRALHAPHPKAKKPDGFGMTLCGKRGTRHQAAGVTCKDCLKRIANGSGPPP